PNAKSVGVSRARPPGVGLAEADNMLRKTYSILAVALTATACGGAAETTTSQTTQQEQPNQQQLAQLAEELAHTNLADALSHKHHFSPLCDSDGYPLPGNINSKEPGATGTTVAQFCEAIGKPKPAPAPPAPQPSPQPQPQPTPAACDKDALNTELSNNYP